MNGAQALIRTLVDAGVDVCFANPGTSEMHFVAALDDVPDMRAVLTLFEGVATGAADGSVQDALVLPAVKDGGAVATVRGYRGDGQRGLRFFPTLVRRVAEDREALDRLRQQAEDGVLTLRVARTVPVEDAAEAHRLLERGGIRGRLVLTF